MTLISLCTTHHHIFYVYGHGGGGVTVKMFSFRVFQTLRRHGHCSSRRDVEEERGESKANTRSKIKKFDCCGVGWVDAEDECFRLAIGLLAILIPREVILPTCLLRTPRPLCL